MSVINVVQQNSTLYRHHKTSSREFSLNISHTSIIASQSRKLLFQHKMTEKDGCFFKKEIDELVLKMTAALVTVMIMLKFFSTWKYHCLLSLRCQRFKMHCLAARNYERFEVPRVAVLMDWLILYESDIIGHLFIQSAEESFVHNHGQSFISTCVQVLICTG